MIRTDSLDAIDMEVPLVVFGVDGRYPGQLSCDTNTDEVEFRVTYRDYVSEYMILVETGLWDAFVERLEADGYTVYVLGSADTVVADHRRWSEPLTVDNLSLPMIGDKPASLFPYQQYALRKALDGNFMFFNHGTGTGKSVTACAGAQELVNQGKIDVVFVFTFKKMKINLVRAFNNFTNLTAVNIEGAKPKRKKEFAAQSADVYVMNYEKANFDYEILAERIKGKRVLFVFDEIQKILIWNKVKHKPNLAAQGVHKLIESVKAPHIWPMSATVINSDPERYFRIFDLPGKKNMKNPLQSVTAFRKNYSWTEMVQSMFGSEVVYHWQIDKLTEVKHIVAPYVHVVRKSDPGVRELFKDTDFVPIMIPMSDEDRELYEMLAESGGEDTPENWGQYYRVMQYLCNTAESIKYSQSEVAQEIAESLPHLTSDTSNKMSTLIEMVEDIKDQGDKVVVFTKYTNLGLFLIGDELTKKGIRHVLHYGAGMTDKQAQMAQDEFKSDPGVTVFLSSDAGSHGLSFQEAKYVINFDCPYSYDTLMQRNDRIDRADSYLSGLTSYVLIMEGTLEERIWEINNKRRQMASAIQGTVEELSRKSEEENLAYLMFG